MKLSYLLLVSFGVVILLIAIIGGIAVSYSSQVTESLGISSSVPKLLLISEVIVLLLGLFVGYFVYRSISVPLKSLSTKIGEITKGNFKVDLAKEEASDVDEIKSLVESLGRVIASLKLAVISAGKKSKTKKKGKSKAELEKLGEKMSKDVRNG